jgi:hypothetical protein
VVPGADRLSRSEAPALVEGVMYIIPIFIYLVALALWIPNPIRVVVMGRSCPYKSCRHCGACGVCQDFHGDAYGGCSEDWCPVTWWSMFVDWWRRWRRTFFGPFDPPWLER